MFLFNSAYLFHTAVPVQIPADNHRDQVTIPGELPMN